MMTDIPGYTSSVHQGPLKPVLIWQVPYKGMIANVLLLMFVALQLTWRWLLAAVVIHLALALLWWIDPYLLASMWEARRYQRWLGVD
jgi:hypothetical protein